MTKQIRLGVLLITSTIMLLVMMRFYEGCNNSFLTTTEDDAKISIGDLETTLFNFKMAPKYHCSTVRRMGNKRDGGWDVCLDDGLKPSNQCLVYSFGIANKWSFDEAMAEIYDCEVHSFDPSINHPDPKHGKNIWYHNIGLSGEDNNWIAKKTKKVWMMKTLPSIIELLNHSGRVIDVLKMDIEMSEWKAIPNMIENNIFSNVKQFAFELHMFGLKITDPEGLIYKMLDLLQSLEEQGLYIYKTESNHRCKYISKFTGKTYAGCKNIWYVNSKYLK